MDRCPAHASPLIHTCPANTHPSHQLLAGVIRLLVALKEQQEEAEKEAKWDSDEEEAEEDGEEDGEEEDDEEVGACTERVAFHGFVFSRANA